MLNEDDLRHLRRRVELAGEALDAGDELAAAASAIVAIAAPRGESADRAVPMNTSPMMQWSYCLATALERTG